MPSTDAATLVTRVAAGDQAAFAELYDHLAPLVFGVVKRVVRDDAHSEEVTQETFLELWRAAGRFDGRRGTVRAWAATIAHRRAVDRVRSEQAHRERLERDRRQQTVTTQQSAEDDAVVEDRQRLAVAALAALPAAQRQVIELAYWDALTHSQIAVHLGVPLGTVKTRIRDGLLRLRAAQEAGA